MARILVVEDEAVLRMTFGEFLEEDSHEVLLAGDFDQAAKLLQERRIDVVVTDIILPGRSGVELLEMIAEEGLRATVIMITGEPNVETAAEAVRLGAFDYLAKPVTGRELKRVVRLALERHKLREERDAFAARMDQYRRELEAIFNSVNEGIVTVSQDMHIRRVNSTAADVLGMQADAMEGLLATEAFPQGMDPALQALRKTLDTRHAMSEFRIEAQAAGNGQHVLMASTTPLVDEAGLHAGAVLLLRDITRITMLERELTDRDSFHGLVGRSRRMQEMTQMVQNVAETDTTVLVTGESGTGKELVATALHELNAQRSKGPFIKVNCSALSEDILESELFGHVKGSFTGAVRDRVGRFEAANRGTILLDEIGDISPRLQQRLLRVLQEREFERVGDTRPIKVDVRVVASTNRDLPRLMERGVFREDLYYRLNVVRIEMPPLRDRREDVPLLVDHFCKRLNTVFNKHVAGVAPETMEILINYPWFGNVRELENALEWAFVVCHHDEILPKHLPPDILNHQPAHTPAAAAVASQHRKGKLSREQIVEVLNRTDWNVSKTARTLGVARNTLYQKMRSLDISRESDYA